MIGGFKDLCYNTTKLKPLISECFADKLGLVFQILCIRDNIVKLRRGSGKDRQGMAVKAKGLKA